MVNIISYFNVILLKLNLIQHFFDILFNFIYCYFWKLTLSSLKRYWSNLTIMKPI